MPERFNRLYDRKTDPLEKRNLFPEPSHAGLKKKLHAETLAWMKKFGDAGLPYQTILEKCAEEETLKLDRQRQLTRAGTGRLKGRPIDFV